MVKKETSKRQTVTSKKIYILWIAVIALAVLQGVSTWYIINLRESINSYSAFVMRTLLKDSEEARYKYPVIDIAENRVYVPEARVFLPLNEVSRDMRYEYRGEDANSGSKALYFSTSSVVGRQAGAQYVSCDKMVTLVPSGEGGAKQNGRVGSIEPTKDGLSDIFVHPDTVSCWNQEMYIKMKQDLAEAVKKAKNY